MPIEAERSLLRLLQLANASLPVGAYAYSEGLEALIEAGTVSDASQLEDWLRQALAYGAVRLEAAIALWVHALLQAGDLASCRHWNRWLSATKETEELRQQSWQMGRALADLLGKLEPETAQALAAVGEPINFSVAFALAAQHWGVSAEASLAAYLHAWLSNQVSVGVKSIPLGQTAGQQLILQLDEAVLATTQAVATWPEEDWASCGWGPSLASMAHETQYSRLYRS